MFSIPKLLITVKHLSEVKEAIAGGADIIDVKDPSRGSLGIPDIGLLAKVVELVGGSKEVSVALGDIVHPNELISFASRGAASLGADYIKIGIGARSLESALKIGELASEGLEVSSSKAGLILVGYADHRRIYSLSPMEIVDIAHRVEAEGVMIDTRIKDGSSTFEFLSDGELREFVARAKAHNLITAIAGMLDLSCISKCIEIGFVVLGFRSAACEGGRSGRLSRGKIGELRNAIISHLSRGL